MRSIRRTLTKTEPEWALTGRNISLWRQPVIEWSAPPSVVMKRICAGNVFVLLSPSSALSFSSSLTAPPSFSFFFLLLNKSFVGVEIRKNFTSLQSASHGVISVTSKWWCIKKASGGLCLRVFLPWNRACVDSAVRERAELHERSIITPHFVLICKMIMGGPCKKWAVRWCILSPSMCFTDCLRGSVKSL